MEKKEESKQPQQQQKKKKGLRLWTRLKACQRYIHCRQTAPIIPPQWDETEHECVHCHYTFKGKLCPQCGTSAEEKHFTLKRLFMNFMDLWGLGTRPMFRSMLDLLWRPGYMIRDYLHGHHLSYFPPLKMLVVTILLVEFIKWVFDIDAEAVRITSENFQVLEHKLKGILIPDVFKQMIDFLADNTFYRFLSLNFILMMAVWTVFRKYGLSLVETLFSQIYINCQMQLLTIIWLLITQEWRSSFFFPYNVPFYIMLPVLLYDFHQLYNVSYGKALWKYFLITLLISLFYFILIFSLTIIFMAIGGGLKEIIETSQ